MKPHVAVDPQKGPFLMLWPALRALSHGELTPDQQQWLIEAFRLDATPRTEGPGAASSIAHRSFTDDNGTRLVLDLARTGESGWVFALFYPEQRPSAGTVEDHRALFRAAIDRLGLTTVEITPAATADEVLVPSLEPSGDAESAFGSHWDLPYDDLDRVWPHVGLRADAPREVKEVKLRELMRTPAWSAAPTALRLQAEEFLRGE
ncbi:hypothetical protein OG373_13795 [Streptomyces avidinii]|uniref:hypothetical protein n=1 Tax=Streptomyces avidinii TaxID=1895 RepID=UPI00386C1376|nr:hypothetical protein OG373_13795 [Streptomyces avidinii]